MEIIISKNIVRTCGYEFILHVYVMILCDAGRLLGSFQGFEENNVESEKKMHLGEAKQSSQCARK